MPGGHAEDSGLKRYTSPLDRIDASQWDATWSTELSNLLSILTQLVDLEDRMAELLTDVGGAHPDQGGAGA